MWSSTIFLFYFLFYLNSSNSCHCDRDRIKGDVGLVELKYKRQPEYEEYTSSDSIEIVPYAKESEGNGLFGDIFKHNISNDDIEEIVGDETTTEVTAEIITETITEPTTTEPTTTTTRTTTTTTMFDITTFEAEEVTVNNPIQCQAYKKSKTFNIGKMADVWKIVYYTMTHRLKCFKLYIKTLTGDEQRQYAQTYGTFNDTVNWSQCILEVRSSDNYRVGVKRKHFLQADYAQREKGVLDNIIIEEDRITNSTTISYHRENADQWLVIKNLLLMRDCETGELAVFTRVPTVPKTAVINEALRFFGEPEVLTDKLQEAEMSTEPSYKNSIVHKYKSKKYYKHDCPAYKKTMPFDLNEMADVWKIVDSTMKLNPIRIIIVSLTYKDRQRLMKKYGDFNRSIEWRKCMLEIKLRHSSRIGVKRRHFLLGTQYDEGVMKNVIIDEVEKDIIKKATVHLLIESPDQWMVYKNLLLMRSCDSGQLAIFKRDSMDPRLFDIKKALEVFGESDRINGTSCLAS